MYLGIEGVAQDTVAEGGGKQLTEFVFEYVREDMGCSPTSVGVVTDYRADMNGEPKHYSG